MACLKKIKVILLFATGTGIAPIRHLIQFIKVNGLGIEIVLFYGCRSLEADFYFEQEWEDLKMTVFAAGSRENPSKKVYLDSIIDDASDFLNAIDISTCACFVAGHTRLNKLVTTSLTSIWGSNLVNELKLDGRYQTETWS
jgi:sulfite reductase alpha subunit-like flavoprotein